VIRFSCKPDAVFSDVLNQAIERTADAYLSFEDARDQEDWLCACMPRSARFFTGQEAKQQLMALRQAHNDSRLHDISRYHWLLLYECLETFAQEFNEQPAGTLSGRYGIQRLHFRRLVRRFFWDTAFLEEAGAKMTRAQSQPIVIIPETLGLFAGFKHHPDELTIQPCELALARDFERQAVPTSLSATTEYPAP
jgi:hypothetical protein